jgi:hypothetical protein
VLSSAQQQQLSINKINSNCQSFRSPFQIRVYKYSNCYSNATAMQRTSTQVIEETATTTTQLTATTTVATYCNSYNLLHQQQQQQQEQQ